MLENVLDGFPEFQWGNTCAGVSSLLEERPWLRFFPVSAWGLPFLKNTLGD